MKPRMWRASRRRRMPLLRKAHIGSAEMRNRFASAEQREPCTTTCSSSAFRPWAALSKSMQTDALRTVSSRMVATPGRLLMRAFGSEDVLPPTCKSIGSMSNACLPHKEVELGSPSGPAGCSHTARKN
eukprot:6199509-Pleurochrysis_carterae.AAC.6